MGIAPGATLVDGGNLGDTAAVVNAGILTVNAADTIGSLTNNAGTLNGSAALSVTGVSLFTGGILAGMLDANGGATLDGSTPAGPVFVTGTLNGTTQASGTVQVSGTSGGGPLSVLSGTTTLTATGASTNATVSIAPGATLVDGGNLGDTAAVTNAGILTVNAVDTIGSYTQDPTGTLAGGASLTVAGTATLKGGTISGSLLGNTINDVSGTLTHTGILGSATTHLDIAAGATLVAAGTQHYSLLTTSGAGTATWQGNLTNPANSTLAPGGVGSIGTLQVTSGNFTNASGAVLKLDITPTGHDSLAMAGPAGVASFGGTLELNQVGGATAPFLPIHLVAAAAYSGNFATLTENLDGAAWFNPRSGDVIRIAVPDGGTTLFGSTTNQTASWMALYDDVIDPGVTNISAVPGGNPSYYMTSGIANGNPDLLWALASSFTASGLNASLLNHLSPEVYAGLSDYAIQATRSHQRSAFDAPPLAPATGQVSSKSSSKQANQTSKLPWEAFAAADYFHIRSSGSQNQADYELGGYGVLAGVRAKPTPRIQLAAYLAGDAGTIDGALMHADSTGWSLGVLGEALLNAATSTCLSAGISYGSYTFDGSRSSVAAGGGGWSPAEVGFSGVTTDALELYVGVDGVAYHNEHFRLIPTFGLHAATGTMDSFSESNNPAAGSPIALAVYADHYTSVLAELSLRAEASLTNKLGVWGQLGISGGIGDTPHVLTARFAKGSRPFQTTADGLSNDAAFCGVGVTYQLSGSVSVALGYRAEFRSDAGSFNGVNLASSFRF